MGYEEQATGTMGIPYYDSLLPEEQQEVTEAVKLLLRKTFVLEWKYEKRSGRFTNNREFRICNKHLEFLRKYFAVSGVSVVENSQMGVIYIQGETLVGDKLPKLATLYLLILKLIYDEQMATVSTSVNIYTSLGEIHEKLGTAVAHRYQKSGHPAEKISGCGAFRSAGRFKWRQQADYLSVHQCGAVR